MGIRIRSFEAQDVDRLKDRLRRADEKELLETGYRTVEMALAESAARSAISFSILVGDNVVGSFGIVPDGLLSESACIWLVGTDELGKIKKTFMMESRRVVNVWLTKYRYLWNFVPKDYHETIRWLKWLGADFREYGKFLVFRIARA